MIHAISMTWENDHFYEGTDYIDRNDVNDSDDININTTDNKLIYSSINLHSHLSSF